MARLQNREIGEHYMTKLEVQEKDGKIYAPLKDKWLVAKPEEKVRQHYRLYNI